MNYNICSIPSCHEKPKYICDCQAEKLVFCKRHKKSHSNSSPLTHRFEYLYREPVKPSPDKHFAIFSRRKIKNKQY
ncbi:unnamed protein product [Blepharisma stoltei]|uniref:Uncharacterized protein n=1 Tax=Blepharisma stoltei TaxID=1481888 RepID=A0AAU9IHL6_9CILI|nr:unnamed protein product [Blepharisma stoltei]